MTSPEYLVNVPEYLETKKFFRSIVCGEIMKYVWWKMYLNEVGVRATPNFTYPKHYPTHIDKAAKLLSDLNDLLALQVKIQMIPGQDLDQVTPFDESDHIIVTRSSELKLVLGAVCHHSMQPLSQFSVNQDRQPWIGRENEQKDEVVFDLLPSTKESYGVRLVIDFADPDNKDEEFKAMLRLEMVEPAM